MNNLKCLLAVFAAGIAALAHASSPFNINQTPNFGAANGVAVSDRYSTNGAGPSHITAADNFNLAIDSSNDYQLTSLSVTGFALNGLGLSQLPNSAIGTYEINILAADGGGNPTHTVLFTRTFSAGDSAVSTAFAAAGTGANTGFNFYKTTFDLSGAPIGLGTGGNYYLNFGVSGSNNATFAWAFSGTGSGISNYLSQNSAGGGWGTWTNSTGANLAFELNGTIETVPEPATFALGIVLLPLLKRRKK
ncbi:MAG: hypothetical protein JNM28_11445 [Armatimonadetes bacterium]|nr:hypothetical protein [Armatimonadota bacterium]